MYLSLLCFSWLRFKRNSDFSACQLLGIICFLHFFMSLVLQVLRGQFVEHYEPMITKVTVNHLGL